VSERSKAASIYESAKRPLRALRDWAGDSIERLGGVVALTQARIASSDSLRDRRATEAERGRRKADALSEKARELWKRSREITDKIEQAESEGGSTTKLKADRDRVRQSIDEIGSERERLIAEVRRDRSAASHWATRIAFWTKTRTVYALRLRRARKKTRPTFEPWMANGHPHSDLTRPVKRAIAQAVAKGGLVVTSTTGGVHSPTSFHYSGRAVDLAGPYVKMTRFQGWLARNYGSRSLEIFGPDSYYYKYGTRYPGAFPAHHDHIHFADE